MTNRPRPLAGVLRISIAQPSPTIRENSAHILSARCPARETACGALFIEAGGVASLSEHHGGSTHGIWRRHLLYRLLDLAGRAGSGVGRSRVGRALGARALAHLGFSADRAR